MTRIHLLPAELANQIAAGEVIERPASVIKELLENSLDANATDIKIDIDRGGSTKIIVTDDGDGIHPDDLITALTRHGTSKIHNFAELMNIQSLGFRGEALASICSISKVTLTSKYYTEDHAQAISAAGVNLTPQLKPSAHPQGTTVEIRDLFFNTPARRKFLRSEKTEFDHIELITARIALSHFDTRFELLHNGKRILLLPQAQSVEQKLARISKVFDKKFVEQAIEFEFERNGLVIKGYISNKNYHVNHTRFQAIYLNNRMVRDRIILHAIKQVYADFLPELTQPAFIVYLTIDPQLFDVNVHPTKHEVRFHEARLIHDFVVHALGQCFSKVADLNKANIPSINESSITTNKYYPKISSNIHQPKISEAIVEKYQQLYQSAGTLPSNAKANIFGEPLTIIDEKILICQAGTHLQFIQIQQLQRLLFEYLALQALSNNQIIHKPLLFPIQLSVNQSEALRFEHIKPWLVTLGYDVDWLSEQHIIIRSKLAVDLELNLQKTLLNLLQVDTIINDGDLESFIKLFTDVSEFNTNHMNLTTVQTMINHHSAIIAQLNKKQFCYDLTTKDMVAWFE